MIRVLIADDHALIREGLSKVFSHETDIEVVAAASNAAEAVQMTVGNEVDVVILDVNMPDKSGIDALKSILAKKPGQAVLMLSMLPEQSFAVRMLREGAAGFVSKESAAAEIVGAVRRVAGGQKYVSPMAADSLAQEISKPTMNAPHEQLSSREFQVLRMIAGGRNSRQIAEELDLSVNTVATYRRRILGKLDLRSDVDVTRFVLEHKLLD